uniref:Cytoskeleton associated protein 2-like n=1 Tax=Cyprinus carpio TaxID=7962 RepID=A0A8C1QLN8_CYPCA
METVTEEDASKLSKIELRKLKLAEYLEAKGRLKAPNPKPYLKEKPVTKKHAENNQKSKTTAEGKENCGTNIKEVKRVKTLAEVDKNTSSEKGLGVSSLAKAQTQPSSNSRNACREGLCVSRTRSNKIASLQIPSKPPHNAEETAAPLKRTRSQSVQQKAQHASQSQAANTRQSRLVSICNPSQSGRVTPALRSTHPSRTIQSTRPSAQKLPETSVKSTSGADLKSQRPVNTTQTEMQRNRVSKTQVKPTQQPRRPSAPQSIRKPNPSTNRSHVNRRKDAFFVDAAKSKSVSSDTIRTTRASASSTLSKPANNEAAALSKNKPPAAVKLTNATASAKRAGRSSRSCVLPAPELQISSQTPKSRLCPGTQGVRTAPRDGAQKPTAAQEDRLRKLQEWRESRSITYKRPPMPVRLVRRKTVSALPQPYWTSMENEDEVHDIVSAVDRSLDDCIQLLQQPVDELRSVVFEILKKRQSQGSSLTPEDSEAEETGVCDEEDGDDIIHTPKPISALISGARGDSSVVKYQISATPGGKRSQRGAEAGQVDGHEIRFFTPVRRSVRIERSARRYPTALQEHEPCVTSLCELAGERQEEVKGQSSAVYVYRENEALADRVHVTLVYPEEDET